MNRIELARQLDYIREGRTGPNAGQRVEAIQKWGGGFKGDSWCCWFATMVLDIEFKGNAPFPRMGSVHELLTLARQQNRVIASPEVGCLVISVDATGHGHHIGICTTVSPLATIAGNTSADGISSNGDRVAEHNVSQTGKVFVRI